MSKAIKKKLSVDEEKSKNRELSPGSKINLNIMVYCEI